jgi:hypothetical protein
MAPREPGIAMLHRCHDQGFIEMSNSAFSALVAAWTTTMIATTIFITALAISQAWDGTVFLHALQRVLTSDV